MSIAAVSREPMKAIVTGAYYTAITGYCIAQDATREQGLLCWWPPSMPRWRPPPPLMEEL